MADEELIDDQYQLVMCVASGSNSQVWEVIEKSTSRHLAMKLLKKDAPEFKLNKVKMKKEANILKSLDCPLIVKFEKFSSNRDHTYIVMEYFRASNLKLQIKSETNKVHLRVRQLFEGVCSALSFVHQKGYVHRDIKPDNVLLNRAGEVRLCDFSLSSKEIKGFGRFFAGKAKEIQGTRTYIAPETIRRQQPTSRTDLYSLGVLFFEVLTCRTPFQAVSPEELLQKHLRVEAPNPSEFNPNVAPEMDRLIARLLKKKPADRPASVDEVLSELKRIRIFKEDIIDEVAMKKLNEDSDALAMLSEIRLDSRADAKLKHMLETNPDFAKKFAEEKIVKAAKKKADNDRLKARIKVAEDADASKKAKTAARNAPAAAAPAPAAPAVQPMAQPMPMMPMPGYPPSFPSYPQGFAPFPQAPMPPGMPMPMPMPGAPQFPQPPQMAFPQAIPPIQPVPFPQQPQPVPMARQPVPPVGSGPGPGQPPVAGTGKPAGIAQPRPVAKPAPPAKPADDLDFMTDLPDVI
jgi:serine/threonine-protein kinase